MELVIGSSQILHTKKLNMLLNFSNQMLGEYVLETEPVYLALYLFVSGVLIIGNCFSPKKNGFVSVLHRSIKIMAINR